MRTATARTLASVSVLGFFLPTVFLHFVIFRIVRVSNNVIANELPWTTGALCGGGTLLSVLLGAGLYALLRHAYPSLRRGVKAWLFPPVFLLAMLIPTCWPFVLLAPAARRLGGRSSCVLAIAGGVSSLLAVLLIFFVVGIGMPLPFPAYYAAWGLIALSTALLLASLAKIAPSRRATRAVAAAFVLLVLLSLATQPAILFRPGLRAEADDALAALIDATGTTLRPDAPYPDAIPPVPPEADPIAALDRSAISTQYNHLATVVASLNARWSTSRPLCRLHPFTPEETARVADALDAAPDLAAAAEAFSAPAYRSSRPGGTTPGDGTFLEPEVENELVYVNFLAWRAAVAAHHGDLPAVRADLDRIANCAAIADSEPAILASYLAASLLKAPFASSAIQTILSLLPDDALDDLPRAADSLAALVASRCGDRIAGETFWTTRNVLSGTWLDGLACPPIYALLSYFPASWRECVELSTQAALYRFYAALAADLRATLALPPDAASDAFQAAFRRAEDHLDALPVFAAILAIAPKHLFPAFLAPRDTANFLRTATAIERHRRARSTLPETLDDLVPDFLPAVPLEAYSGQPYAYQPGPIELPEEPLDASSAPDAPSPAVLPPITLPGYLLTFPPKRAGEAGSPVFFPVGSAGKSS